MATMAADSFIPNLQVSLLLALIALGAIAFVLTVSRVLNLRIRWLPRWLRLHRLSDLVLSSDPEQKQIGRRFFMGVANCAAGVLALNVCAAHGLIDQRASSWLTLTATLVTAVFYVLMRSGLNRRFNDPALLDWQGAVAILYLAWGYMIAGPASPLALVLLIVILLFSMFTNTPRQLFRGCLLASLSFGAAMIAVARDVDAAPNAAVMQLVYACVLLLALSSICLLVHQMHLLRLKTQERQKDLSEALDRIRELATHDDLTGLINRRRMLELMNTEKHRTVRSGRSFCVAMIDIDHFKQVNDRLGHSAGDEVLSQVASTISDGLRETDIVARWGGEEFLVLFTDTSDEAAEKVLMRIQDALAQTTVTQVDPSLRITISAGVGNHLRGEPLTRTVDRADKALYAAKAAGRNRILRALSSNGGDELTQAA
jgi:diguanylate cyclase (GGDEF)-like protein